MNDQLTVVRFGKLIEELGELQAVVARVITQGIDEIDPSGKVNRERLCDKLADAIAQCELIANQYFPDPANFYLWSRIAEKKRQMREWESLQN